MQSTARCKQMLMAAESEEKIQRETKEGRQVK